MKNFLIATFIFLSCSSFFAQTNQQLPKVTTIGEATVYAAPDEILLSFTVTTADLEIEKAKQKNTDISMAAIQFLKEQGIPNRHIQTQHRSVYPKINRRSDLDHRISHFNVSQTIQICIKKIATYENIVDGLIARGVWTIGSPIFRNTELEKYKNQARQKAVLAAKEKAVLLAGTLGQSVGAAYFINESFSAPQNFQQAYGSSTVSNNSGADSAFELGQMEINARVEISFLLK